MILFATCIILSEHVFLSVFAHLYSPRMVEEIKEEKKLEHQTLLVLIVCFWCMSMWVCDCVCDFVFGSSF